MNKQEFEVLLLENYEKARPAVCGILRWTRQDVDDVLQTAAMSAWRAYERFEGRSPFRTWWLRIAMNSAYYHLRKEKARHAQAHDEIKETTLTTSDNPEKLAIRKEQLEIVWEQVQRLTPKRRRMLLRWMNGHPMNSGAEKSRVYRAKEIIQKNLGLYTRKDIAQGAEEKYVTQ